MEALVASTAPAVWDHAVETFGSESRALVWFHTPLSELNNQTPEQFLTAPDYAVVVYESAEQTVDDILTKIDYGVF